MTLTKINTYTKYILAIVMGVAMFFVFSLLVSRYALAYDEVPGDNSGWSSTGPDSSGGYEGGPNAGGNAGGMQTGSPTPTPTHDKTQSPTPTHDITPSTGDTTPDSTGTDTSPGAGESGHGDDVVRDNSGNIISCPDSMKLVSTTEREHGDITVHNSCQYITPTCDSFKASDKTINYGESTTLTWETSYASDVTMTRPKGTPTVDADGSLVVTPKKDFTFKLNLTNPIGQTATCKKKITVIPPPAPTCNITSDKSTLEKGDTATLSWTSTDVDQAILTRPFGDQEVDNNTTLLVSPNETHNFELKVTNPTGEATCAVNIDVTEPAVPPAPRDPATCTLVASPDLVPSTGADVTFTWTTQNANGSALWGAGKTADGNGGINPLPGTDSSYTMFVTPGTKTFQVWNEVSNNTCTVNISTLDIRPDITNSANPTLNLLKRLRARVAELRARANQRLQAVGVSEDTIHRLELQRRVRTSPKAHSEVEQIKSSLEGQTPAEKISTLRDKVTELHSRTVNKLKQRRNRRNGNVLGARTINLDYYFNRIENSIDRMINSF